MDKEKYLDSVSKRVFAPIKLVDLYWCAPPKQVQKDIVDAIHDSKRNSANIIKS